MIQLPKSFTQVLIKQQALQVHLQKTPIKVGYIYLLKEAKKALTKMNLEFGLCS
jgi:hypothetical protein